MQSALSIALIALTLIDCAGTADPDAGPPTGDACVAVVPELAMCEGPRGAFTYSVEPLTHDLASDVALDATWMPADAGALHFRIDDTTERVRVPVDPTPLNALIAEGDAVRVLVSEGTIRLERLDGSLLLDVSTDVRWSSDPTLPSIAGFDRTMTATPSCDIVEEYSTFCAPMIVRFWSIEVTGENEPIVIAPHDSAEVATEAGTFRVSNLTVNRGLHAEPEGCFHCAPAFSATARIGIVRVR